MTAEIRAIEAFFQQRYDREALYVPSGRVALYLAFREWLQPGDRLLMSPVNDDVVFFVVLAAGLVPVLGPLDPHTGNLDPTAIGDAAWSTLRGVLTTNLYGIPDRMDALAERCRRNDLVLLEDAAHALDSRWNGRRIGQFGVAAAYSLHKHLGVVGGVLTFDDASRRASLEREAGLVLRHHSFAGGIARGARAALSGLAGRTAAGRWLRRVRGRLIPAPQERPGYRMAYETAAVRLAQKAGGGVSRFERWVRVDNHQYATWPPGFTRRDAVRRLDAFEQDRHRWLAGVNTLLASGLVPSWLALPPGTALFRVPLFVRQRDVVRARLAQRGLALDYIYHPPLDRYAPGLTDRLASSRGAAHWSRDVLPVDPLQAARFLAESQALLEPWQPSPQDVAQLT